MTHKPDSEHLTILHIVYDHTIFMHYTPAESHQSLYSI